MSMRLRVSNFGFIYALELPHLQDPEITSLTWLSWLILDHSSDECLSSSQVLVSSPVTEGVASVRDDYGDASGHHLGIHYKKSPS
jgi:hypothetical protein